MPITSHGRPLARLQRAGDTGLRLVYFGNSIQNPNAADCHLVFPVARTVPASPDKLTAAMTELLGMTARTAAQTSPVRYAINGQPKPFWEWLQMGCDASNDNCDPAPFA